MKMGLSQTDAARRLNVSCSVVQWLWNQFQTTDSVSRRPVPGWPWVTTPTKDCYLALLAQRSRTTAVPQFIADHFVAPGRRISATTVRRCLLNASMYARRPFVCIPFEGTAQKCSFTLGKVTCLLDQTIMGFCTLHWWVPVYIAEQQQMSVC